MGWLCWWTPIRRSGRRCSLSPQPRMCCPSQSTGLAKEIMETEKWKVEHVRQQKSPASNTFFKRRGCLQGERTQHRTGSAAGNEVIMQQLAGYWVSETMWSASCSPIHPSRHGCKVPSWWNLSTCLHPRLSCAPSSVCLWFMSIECLSRDPNERVTVAKSWGCHLACLSSPSPSDEMSRQARPPHSTQYSSLPYMQGLS